MTETEWCWRAHYWDWRRRLCCLPPGWLNAYQKGCAVLARLFNPPVGTVLVDGNDILDLDLDAQGLAVWATAAR